MTDEDEELVEKCLEIIRQEKKASTSMLQRRLRLGYTRAARIVDILENRGVLGPENGAKGREILVDLDSIVNNGGQLSPKSEVYSGERPVLGYNMTASGSGVDYG